MKKSQQVSAKAQWVSSVFPGVRFREHPMRRHGQRRDRYFAIRYQVDGKRVEEGLGWSSQGWNERKAALELAELKQAARTGRGHTRLAERRKEAAREKQQNLADALTFSAFFVDTYLPNAQENKSISSFRSEGFLYKNWIAPFIGDKPLREISPLHLEQIKKTMKDKARAPQTITYTLAVIRQAFNLAYRLGTYVGINPVSQVKKPRCDNRRMRFLSHEEAARLLEHLRIRSKQLHDMALLSLHCGLRAGEIFSLTWHDIDLQRGLITVRDTKSGRNRKAFMTTEVKALFEHAERHGALIFADKDGQKIKKISNTFDHAVTDLGLNVGVTDSRDRLVFHSLRHSFASWLVENGVDLYTVKTLLGHQSITMTERYSHLGQTTLSDAVRKLDASMKTAKHAKTGKLALVGAEHE